MTIQSKSYMNFLGGEVSPNVYKRLDMANNSKWFETAKNIYFGTTGDFYNRRGFKYIARTATGLNNEKIKLIPFIFNKENSYCIEFNSNTFRILKNGSLLKDNNNNVINIRHDGVSSESIDDISYAQVGDILYIATGGKNKIYTIIRSSETDWSWNEFDYIVPPMRKVNDDSDKSLLFEENTTYDSSGQFQIDVSAFFSTLSNIVVYAKESGVWSSIYTTSSSFASWENFVIDFNSNQTATTKINGCSFSGRLITFFCTAAGSNIEGFRIKLGTLTKQEVTKTYSLFSPDEQNVTHSEPSESKISGYYYYYLPSGSIIKEISGHYGDLNYGQDFSYQFFSPAYESPHNVASLVSRGGFETVVYDANNNRFSCTFEEDLQTLFFTGTRITKLVYFSVIGSEVTLETTSKIIVGFLSQNYDVSANFNFFENKEIGDVFAVDSIFSPNRDGKPNENKSYYGNNISAGEFLTDAFWSNGNWRFVTSGMFSGTIELQYSYDGLNWYSHRTFSSSIRTESGVSYSTNYNEYGTIDADDNILLRLSFKISDATNLSVLLDTESFKNRSYYKILEKDSLTPNTKAIVKCIMYSVGTPGMTKQGSGEGVYSINRVDEWSESAWSYQFGFPKVVFLYQNRLGFANTIKDPQTLWFSKTDNYKDFSTTIEYKDDDPITISVLKPTGISEITGIAASKKLFVFTGDREYGIKDEGALSQANKELVSFSTYGSEPIETRVVSNRVVFVEQGARAARSLVYDYAQENYEAPDLTIPYKHLLTHETIKSTEYLPGEYKSYLMLTDSGRILVFKYIPDQRIEAVSWFKHAAGNISNICVVSNKQSYDLYICVEHKGYKSIEYMNVVPYQKGMYLDSYKEYKFDSDTVAFSDPDYLLSETEYVAFIDDVFYKVQTDEFGKVHLPFKTKSVVIGLSYQSEGTLIEPNIMFQSGTTNYNRKNLFKVHCSFVDSCGFDVCVKNKKNGFKKVYSLEQNNVEEQYKLYSGSRSFALQSSYLEPNMLSFVQNLPYPMNIVNSEIEVDYGGK